VGEKLRPQSPEALVSGALVDWWRVAHIDESQLVLRSEGWFPGDAWLGYRIREGSLQQVAAFRPRGCRDSFIGSCSDHFTASCSIGWFDTAYVGRPWPRLLTSWRASTVTFTSVTSATPSGDQSDSMSLGDSIAIFVDDDIRSTDCSQSHVSGAPAFEILINRT